MTRVRKDGFTLVELLVVIGIIALLISILLPAMSRARAEAKRVVCLSNLRTLGQCYVLYVNENKGKGLFSVYASNPPPGASLFNQYWFASNTKYPAGYQWDVKQGYLSKFFKNPAFLNCPSASEFYKTFVGASDLGEVPLTSYAYNGNIESESSSARFKNASETCALIDAIDLVNDTTGTPSGIFRFNAPRLNESGKLIYKTPTFHGRHAGRGSVLWYDGHATTEPPYITTLELNLVTDGSPSYATPAGMATIQRIKMGYLTPVTKFETPEIKFFNNFSKSNVSYYFWADKTARK